jgi:hypothetical protein
LKTLFTGELFNSFWCSIGVHLPGGLIEIEDELSRNTAQRRGALPAAIIFSSNF